MEVTEMRGIENGQSIEEVAENGGDEEVGGIPPVAGVHTQLSLEAGGEAPTTASMTLQGGAVPVEGQFEKGEVVRFYIEARVSSVAFEDKWDSKLMDVIQTERKHKAKVVGIRRID